MLMLDSVGKLSEINQLEGGFESKEKLVFTLTSSRKGGGETDKVTGDKN